MHRLLVLFLLVVPQLVIGQAISTLAGNGVTGYSGDNGAAVGGSMNRPFGVAVDRAGNAYVADRGNNVIRKISVAGIISTIAGTGVGGYNGDNIAATNAQINNVTGVALDGAGNVYIADLSNYRIRKVDTFGVISTVAGTGIAGYNGDGIAATLARLNNPRGVSVDVASNVFIADQANGRVRKVLANGMIITVAGNGTGGYGGDNGAATDAQLNNPYSMASDRLGNLYIADVDNERIRRVDNGGIITTIAGNGIAGYGGDAGAATEAQLSEPTGVAVDSIGNVFIADAWNARIRQVDIGGKINTLAGTGTAGFSGDGGPAALAQLNTPYGVAVNRQGDVFIGDYANNRIRFVTRPTSVESVFSTGKVCIYPNPGSGRFWVDVPIGAFQNQRVIIRNCKGDCVFNEEVKEAHMGITLTEPDGIYFVEVVGDGGTISIPIQIVAGY